MRTLVGGVRADTQLWGNNSLHAMNIADEVVTGCEGLWGVKADVGGVSTSMYKLRPLATIGETGALAVPSEMLSVTLDLNRYQRELGANSLSDSRIIPVYGTGQYGYSGAIVATAHSTRYQLERLGITGITGFIESANLQLARERMGFVAPLHVPFETVDYVNNKCVFLDAMKEIGVPIAYGETSRSEDAVWQSFERIKKMGARSVYAKLGRAASGQWVFPIEISQPEHLADFLALPQTKAQIGTIGVRLDYGIEGIVDSPNVMIAVGATRETDVFISASSQLLAKRHETDERPTVHKGNISGLDPRLQEVLVGHAQKIADWMRTIGAFGIVGLDFVVTNAGEIYIMEANYRVNGGLAAAMKGHDLQSPYWAASGGVKVPKGTTLDEYARFLQRSRIEFDGKSGVLLLNPATSPAGSMQIAVFGKTKDQIAQIMLWVDMS